MKPTSFIYADYWSHALSESSLAQGALENADIRSWEKIPTEYLASGRVGAQINQHFFKNIPNSQTDIEVVLRPFVFTLSLEHLLQKGLHLPRVIAPITTLALLKRNGRLYPTKSFFARDILEPAQQQIYTIGTVDDLDTHLKGCEQRYSSTFSSSKNTFHTEQKTVDEQWNAYYTACQQALNDVCANWLQKQRFYEMLPNGFLCIKENIKHQTDGIKSFYQYLSQNKSLDLPLFQAYAVQSTPPTEPLLPAYSHFSKRLASPSNKIRYTKSQRQALTHAVNIRNGEILPIITPANTGKIALIKAIVATQWVKAALAKGPPPICFAISNNAASIHEITKAFGQELLLADNPFEGRWLSKTKHNKETHARTPLPALSQAELADNFFTFIESKEYFDTAKADYLIAAQLNHPQIKEHSIHDVIDFLHDLLEKEVGRLEQLESTWQSIFDTQKSAASQFEGTLNDALFQAEERVKQALSEAKIFSLFYQSWQQYYKDNVKGLSSLLSILPSQTERQRIDAENFLHQNYPFEHNFDACETAFEIDEEINTLQTEKETELERAKAQQQELQQAQNSEKILSINWAESVIDLLSESGLDRVNTLEEADPAADWTIRFNIFQLATHYWEGRWLLEMEEQHQNPHFNFRSNEEHHMLRKWRSRMMYTPCMSTTCYALPNLFKAKSESPTADRYLVNQIDLLIVDQAAQISPEMAAPAFALAKKAIVLGDTQQSTPAPQVSRNTDIAYLKQYDFIPNESNAEQIYHLIPALDRTVTAGNVMKIAQTVCKYQPEENTLPGILLSEQHASYDEIVDYCNAVAYQNMLKPQRGKKIYAAILEKKMLDAIPPLGYAHVEGFASKSNNGGYENKIEAVAIAQWLHDHKNRLEHYYQKPLAKTIAITCVYSKQIKYIIDACQSLGLFASTNPTDNAILVCTSPILQGYKKSIVIVSHVHTKHTPLATPNGSAELLNISASHASDALLLFADMDTLEQALPASPYALLTQKLLSNPSNQIPLKISARKDLLEHKDALYTSPTTVKTMQTQHEHQQFFKQLMRSAEKEILIACPALELYQLEGSETFEHIVAAIERGVSVTIYTDPFLVKHNHDADAPNSSISMGLRKKIQKFRGINIPVHVVPRVYQSILMVDQHTYSVGSYHWFFPSNNQLSHVYTGLAVAPEITTQKLNLQNKTKLHY